MARFGPARVDVAEVHDAFAPFELISLEDLGLFPPGKAGRATLDGDTAIDGRLPINTSGGLKARGHPLAGTGIAQIVECVWQLTGRWAEAEQAYLEALKVARDGRRPAVLAAAERDLGDLYMYNRSYAEAVTWLRRSVDGFERLGDDTGLCRALDRLTFALLQQGTDDEALTTAEVIRNFKGGAE